MGLLKPHERHRRRHDECLITFAAVRAKVQRSVAPSSASLRNSCPMQSWRTKIKNRSQRNLRAVFVEINDKFACEIRLPPKPIFLSSNIKSRGSGKAFPEWVRATARSRKRMEQDASERNQLSRRNSAAIFTSCAGHSAG